MSDARHEPGYLPLNRSEALTDGIFAVAMILLVIELKLPEHGLVHSAADLHAALPALLPKAIAWVLIAALVPIPAIGNAAFMLMAVISPWSRRLERRRAPAAIDAAAGKA
jgi:hypothetical protein